MGFGDKTFNWLGQKGVFIQWHNLPGKVRNSWINVKEEISSQLIWSELRQCLVAGNIWRSWFFFLLFFFSFFEKGFNERKKKLFYKLHIVVLNYFRNLNLKKREREGVMMQTVEMSYVYRVGMCLSLVLQRWSHLTDSLSPYLFFLWHLVWWYPTPTIKAMGIKMEGTTDTPKYINK